LTTKLFIESPSSLKNEKSTYTYSRYLTQDVENCVDQPFDIKISHHQDILKPIIFKHEYKLVNSIPGGGKKFCDVCVALDNHEKTTALSVPVNTGCKQEICRPNLKLVGVLKGVEDRLTIGSIKNISLFYNVTNEGEPAYSTVLSVVIPETVKYISIPSSCTQDKSEIVCRIRSNKPLKLNEKFDFEIILDVSKAKGDFLNIIATVSSYGVELNRTDNSVSFKIILEEHSVINVQR
jgi:hypothetical protein